MKKAIRLYDSKKGTYFKEINVIPSRYIISICLIALEVIQIIAILLLLWYFIPYFYLAIYLTTAITAIIIITKKENPDYKVPWLVAVLTIPVVGVMLYFMFSKRKLPKHIIKKLNVINDKIDYDLHNDNLENLKQDNKYLYSQALNLCNISNTNLYKNTKFKYYKLGDDVFDDMLSCLKDAKEFIFLEYFIIEPGILWDSILDILIEKARNNVLVKILYDDIGCMMTLPGDYYKKLQKFNIKCLPFSKLRGTADGEFNNRSHRKIMVIDGKVSFTGGMNLADEYINKVEKFGHWKDVALKIEGQLVNELTRLFLIDFYLNDKKDKEYEFEKYYKFDFNISNNNYAISFGDGPKPIYNMNVGKIAIMNMLNQATNYVYISTPYLIVDNEILNCISNASLRGVDVRIIIPHIPDKKIVFWLTKNSCDILLKSNVKIYEYKKGFIHSKNYIADDNVGIIGTLNLDYRSLTHHFENGIWFNDRELIKEVKNDFIDLFQNSIHYETKKTNIFKRIITTLVKMFSPLF